MGHRQFANVPLDGTIGEIGHTIGLSFVLRRLVEYVAKDPDVAKELAIHLSALAKEDLYKLAGSQVDADVDDHIKMRAASAIDHVLLPLINQATVRETLRVIESDPDPQ